MLLSPYFLLGLTSFIDDKHIETAFFCVYFLFSFSLFLCLLLFRYLLVHRASHCTVQPCRLQSDTLQNNASIICLHSRLSFAVLAWGLMLQQAGTRVPILDCRASYLIIACLWGDQSHHHCFTKFKKSLSLSLHFSLSTRLSNMLLSKKKK